MPYYFVLALGNISQNAISICRRMSRHGNDIEQSQAYLCGMYKDLDQLLNPMRRQQLCVLLK
jgi:hypothetical protein